MSDDNPKSPRAQREAALADLRILERLIDRLLKRAITHAGTGKVADRLQEILLVNGGLGALVDRLEAIEKQEGKSRL